MNVLYPVVAGTTANQRSEDFPAFDHRSLSQACTAYAANPRRYQGRVRPTDNDIILAVKHISEVDFKKAYSQPEGAEAVCESLLQITNEFLKVLRSPENKTLAYVKDLNVLIEVYNFQKLQGSALLHEAPEDKTYLLYREREQELENAVLSLNYFFKEKIREGRSEARKKKKKRTTAMNLSFPLIGMFGSHQFYLRSWDGIGYLIFSWTLIPFFIALKDFIVFYRMDDETFDQQYNKEYIYYRDFPFV